MKNSETIKLSTLPKTWILDLDGTIFKHNSHLNGKDILVDGIKAFFRNNIKDNDFVIVLTARDIMYKKSTVENLKKNNLRVDQIIFNLPVGERIIINDKKPSGLFTAFAVNTKRDKKIQTKFLIDKDI